MSTPALLVRPATADDRAFVCSTWVNGYAHSIRDRARRAAAVAFRCSYVDPILSEAPRIVVLCSPDNPRSLHGHAIATREGVLAWAYVTRDLRRNGYARALIGAAMGSYGDKIPMHFRWPFESERFIFTKYERRPTGRQTAA